MSYNLRCNIPVILLMSIFFLSCTKKEDVAKVESKELAQLTSAENKKESNINSYEIDSTILITDLKGNIIGGDVNDWDFDEDNYKQISEYNYMFRLPIYKLDPVPTTYGLDESFYYEVYGDDLILKWITSSEMDNKGFYVERADNSSGNNPTWAEIGFVNGNGNSEKLNKYSFTDKNLRKGLYRYRLKMVSNSGEVEFFNLPYEITMTTYPMGFAFFPAYPNPFEDICYIRFYLPKKDVVSLYFLNGKDTTYLLDHELEYRGFYKISIDKKSLGFENEVKRLYIDCESCNKKKNFGDIQFY